MDFLDPKKQRIHKIRLMVGYVLIAIALGIATTILLYQAYGFGFDKNGSVIQNGLVFLSTQPSPARIYVNGLPGNSQTNTRLQLPAGQYTVQLERDGYRTWQRAITVAGGDVQHFDYPFLFPTKLATTSMKQYASAPDLFAQTPDRHWLVAQDSADFDSFDVYDLTKPKTASTTISLPKGVMSATDGAESWQVVQWSTDNVHLLLKHFYQKAGQPQSEYIMLDRADATQSFNLTKALGANPQTIELRNDTYDQYWLYDRTTMTLSVASLKVPTPTTYLTHVLDFKPYDANIVLYTSDQAMAPGKVSIKLYQGNISYPIREVAPSASPYLIDLAQYSGDWYVVAGSPVEGKVYIYKDPAGQLQGHTGTLPGAMRVLRVPDPSYVSFSANAQYIMAESGTTFGVYDIFNEHQYMYTVKRPMDAPQSHATWMDGARLTYVSSGEVLVFDYDSTNQQLLEGALPQYAPLFDRTYTYSFSVSAAPVAATADKPPSVTYHLNDTALRTPPDI